MATWIIQNTGKTKKTTEKKIFANLKLKKFWRVPIFIAAAEYIVCSSYGNGHCPSDHVVLCCFVEIKVLQHVNKTFGEVIKNTKSAHGQVYKSNFIEFLLLFANQRLVFELFPLRIIS